MDRLGNIEAFVRAAELGSFTLAAQRLGISPSALSRRIAQLEGELGVRLLQRTTRAVRLSEDGRAFFERCRDSLRDLTEAQEAVTKLRQRPAGLLRVEAPTLLGRHLLVPAVSRFLARYPEVRVDLALRDQPAGFTEEGIDVAVRLGSLEDSALVVRKLGTTRMRICGAPGYLRRRGTPRTFEALTRHERLGYSTQGVSLPWRLRDGDRERDLPPSGRFCCNHVEALLELGLAGAGLLWACDFVVSRAMGAGTLVEVLPTSACVESSVNLLTLPSRQVLPKVRAFVDFVSRELAEAGGAQKR